MFKGFSRFLQRPGERLKSLFGPESARADAAEPVLQQIVLPRDEHSVSRKNLSENALKVLYRLNGAGYDAYLVGGCIRDSLLGRQPKDFDVATSATPDEVRQLFRNSRIIGRRFRIVHVRFGREIIEVTTFRGSHGDGDDGNVSQQSDQGLLLRDNVWGSVEEDAIRRDFTVNALYYSVSDFSIYDWTGGIADLDLRLLRLIGDPETRYREDPVRMLRAARFAAKLDFEIEAGTEAPIRELAPLLLQIPPARLFEEVLKLFLSGHAVQSFRCLRELGLYAMLFPESDEALAELPWAESLVEQALANTDARLAEDRPVTPAFLFAALLWPCVVQRTAQVAHEQELPDVPAQQAAAQQVISRQLKHTSIPKRFSIPMREIWDLQQHLPRRRGRKVFQTLEHPRFRAAYDFLLLREQAGELTPELGEWWTEFQHADESRQHELMQQVDGGHPASTNGKPKRRRQRKRRRPSNRAAPPTLDE
ncbi:polynucleotide adenylyltransferase PcnB [Salinicola endophyticus]|uniref:Poly(A) polymerase I n=1 Tax=Salinicola endophyticus TaxID=1949083 RepID=A0ABY8FJX8_9GAMM|nr:MULTISPECIES: polynucleotide adenylyltransferase PcnB [Salinicola]WFF40916.1 polynucleotide adenylyltransferase PcnB [Salinicola endophyticus]